MHIYETIAKLCKENKIAITALESELGFGRGTIGKWKKGTKPNTERVQKIADYFNIPIDYLMTGEIERKIDGANIIEEKAALIARITKDSELLITIEEYYSLSEAMKQFVRNMVHDLTVRDIED
jgi:transcriptional regulator with XRE-family HTH domain